MMERGEVSERNYSRILPLTILSWVIPDALSQRLFASQRLELFYPVAEVPTLLAHSINANL